MNFSIICNLNTKAMLFPTSHRLRMEKRLVVEERRAFAVKFIILNASDLVSRELEYDVIYYVQYQEECRDFTKCREIRQKTITKITTETQTVMENYLCQREKYSEIQRNTVTLRIILVFFLTLYLFQIKRGQGGASLITSIYFGCVLTQLSSEL